MVRTSRGAPCALALALALPMAASAQQVTNTRTAAVYPTLSGPGGAIAAAIAGDTLVVDGILADSAVVDRDLTIAGNPGAAIVSGAAVILDVSANVDLTVDNLLLDGTGNTQGITARGGGTTLVVSDTTFSTGTTALNAHGGGIEAIDPTLVQLDRVVFDGDPGRVWAALGGAVYVSAVAEVPVVISDTVFDTVKATNNGGAVWVSNIDLQLYGASFAKVIGGFGGSVYATGGHLTVEQSTFCGGQGSLGGAVFSDATVELRSSVFAEGLATIKGGAVYANGGDWIMDNNAFLGVAGPSAVFVSVLSNLDSLENNLVMSCPGTKAIDAVLPAGPSPVLYNWFHANGGNNNGFVLDPTNITTGGDPGLTAWSADGDCTNDAFWPEIGSPLVDAGDPAILDGDGTRSDIGAFGGIAADPYYFSDHDGDGIVFLLDCDDSDPAVFGGNAEVCDDIDNDCDGQIDEDPVDVDAFHADCDLDGQGAPAIGSQGCDPPAQPPACPGGVWLSFFDLGLLAQSDCDDTDPSVFLGAVETCDPGDQNCDGDDDQGAIDMLTYYDDDDADGYGDTVVMSCSATAPPGAAALPGDCDDHVFGTHPGAADACGDGIDQDCNGYDGTDADLVLWYPDADSDGFGDPDGVPVLDCRPGAGLGYADDATDCDDGDPTVNPGEAEVCDGRDEDCSGVADDLGAPQTWLLDDDGDGFGDPELGASADCPPAGHVSGALEDCDDTDPSVHPGATETCDGEDDDCDGTVDDTGVPFTWYADTDRDGYGDPLSTVLADCVPPGYVADASDCDDTRSDVHPLALELCDGADNDCNAMIDDTGPVITWYADTDGDGDGDPNAPMDTACPPGAGWSLTDGDCDDTAADVFPGAPETCDGRDEDCDGAIDDAPPLTWYADADGDGYGNPLAPTLAPCAPPPGFVADATDCNDATDLAHPGAVEACNGRDEDCDGTVDNTGILVTYHADADGDGFGDPLAPVDAECPTGGLVGDATDCDDGDDHVFPGATDTCNGIDDDCNGVIDNVGAASTWYLDVDADGYGDDAVTVVADCAPFGFVVEGGDCDDADPGLSPGADEACDGLDNDCDGIVDNADGTTLWFADTDGDGYGDSAASVVAGCPLAGYTTLAGDCNDQVPAVYPGATEVCDGVDEDCDGVIDDVGTPSTWYADADGDGYGDPLVAVDADCPPDGYVADATDCDDTDDTVHPLATEVVDGRDDDCDGVIDDVVITGDTSDTADTADTADTGAPPTTDGATDAGTTDATDATNVATDDVRPAAYQGVPDTTGCGCASAPGSSTWPGAWAALSVVTAAGWAGRRRRAR